MNEIVQIHQYSPSTGHSSMALPVEQIMSQLQRGDCEDIEEEDDIAEGPELEEELGNEELSRIPNWKLLRVNATDAIGWSLTMSTFASSVRTRGQRKQPCGNVLKEEDWGANLKLGRRIQMVLVL